MENSILNIEWEAGGSLPINANTAYRCDQGSGTSKIKIIYHQVHQNSPWILELDFNKDITAVDKLALETALIRAQEKPSSFVNFKMPSGAVLKSSVPFTGLQKN